MMRLGPRRCTRVRNRFKVHWIQSPPEWHSIERAHALLQCAYDANGDTVAARYTLSKSIFSTDTLRPNRAVKDPRLVKRLVPDTSSLSVERSGPTSPHPCACPIPRAYECVYRAFTTGTRNFAFHAREPEIIFLSRPPSSSPPQPSTGVTVHAHRRATAFSSDYCTRTHRNRQWSVRCRTRTPTTTRTPIACPRLACPSLTAVGAHTHAARAYTSWSSSSSSSASGAVHFDNVRLQQAVGYYWKGPVGWRTRTRVYSVPTLTWQTRWVIIIIIVMTIRGNTLQRQLVWEKFVYFSRFNPPLKYTFCTVRNIFK